MILAIDFDGVLHDYKHPVPGRRMGAPIVGAAEAMRQLASQRHKLIIFSIWGNQAKVIKDWCDFWNVPYDDVTNIKPNADAYIDDKAIRFTNWPDVMGQLSNVRSNNSHQKVA